MLENGAMINNNNIRIRIIVKKEEEVEAKEIVTMLVV